MKNLKGIILALVSSGTFGLIPLFSIPIMSTGMDTTSILFYRFLISSILMGAICLFQKRSLKIPSKHFLTIFILGLLYAATALLLIQAYNYIPSGMATTIHFMYPVLVSVIMVLFFKERKSVILLFAALLSVVGVVLLCWNTDGATVHITGLIVAGLTIVTYATYIVGINQTEAGKINAEVLTFYILTFGALFFFVASLISPHGIGAIPDVPSFVRIFLLALVCTVVSDLTLVMAIKLVGSTITSILGSMEPLVAVAVGVVVFSEKMSLLSYGGIALIIVAVTLVVMRNARGGGKMKESTRHVEKKQKIEI